MIGRQRNGTNAAIYHVQGSAKRPGSTLAYEGQTANYVVGDILTGGTSAATARIVADSDGGATGTLTLIDIDGQFVDGETVTTAAGGSATANGTLVAQNVTALGSINIVRTYEDDVSWAVDFVANVGEMELRVTGAASKTIEWLADVRAVVT